MKHAFVFLVAALPLLFVSGQSFADAPETADNAPASMPAPSDSRHATVPVAPQAVPDDAPTASQAATPAASGPAAAEPRADAPDDDAAYCVIPDAVRSPLAAFRLGMTEEEAKRLGAGPTAVPGMLQLPIPEKAWTGVAQFRDGRAAALVLFTHMDAELPGKLFDRLRAKGFMPLAVQPSEGPDLYRLAAEGMDADACMDALRERLDAPSGSDGEARTALFVPKAFFDELANAAPDRNKERDILKAHANDRIFAITLDKAASELTCIIASWEVCLTQP